MSHIYFQTHARPFRDGNRWLVMALIVWSTMTATLSAQVGETQNATFTGTWRHLRGEAEQARRNEAIDRATKDMGFVVRGRAREAIRKATAPAPELTISDQGDRVTVVMGGRRVTLTTDGSPTTMSGPRGAGIVSARRQPGQLILTVRGKSGTQTTSYHLADGGRRLILDVRMTSQTLTKPLAYQVTYVRR